MRTPTRLKLGRWALSLQSYNYTIEHIDGTRNLWADAISRWGLPAPALRTTAVMAVVQRPLHPFEDSDFVFPTEEAVVLSQNNTAIDISQRNDLSHSSEGIVLHRGKLWVPEDQDEIFMRLCIVAHCGTMGHRGSRSTARRLGKYVSCRKFLTKVQNFCNACLLCLQTKGGHRIPRPLGRTLQAESVNQFLHIDYFYVGDSTEHLKYVLLLKDGLSHFVELVATANADSETVVETLRAWQSRYGTVACLVSDRGSHFVNSVVQDLRSRMKSQQHLVTAYCPWANRAERPNKDMMAAFRVILAEYKIGMENWPEALPIVQSVLNSTPVDSLAGLSPMEVFLGREPKTPLTTIFGKRTKEFSQVPASTEQIKEQYELLRERLKNIHRRVIDCATSKHLANSKPSLPRCPKHANFAIGDFVLWSRIDHAPPGTTKMTFIWRGPFRVIAIESDWIYIIEHVLNHKQHTVHASRLKFYHDSSLDITTDLKEHIATQGFLYEVEEFLELRWNATRKIWEVNIRWKGFENLEDSYEPLIQICKDMPEKTIKFLLTITDEDKIRKLRRTTTLKKLILTKAKTHSIDVSPLYPKSTVRQ